jgi:hypothetical protein
MMKLQEPVEIDQVYLASTNTLQAMTYCIRQLLNGTQKDGTHVMRDVRQEH